MKVIVKQNRNLVIINSQNTQNEHIVETIELTVPQKYESWIKKIVFITPQNVVSRYFDNNEYIIERDILQFNVVEFYIWLTNDEQDFRSKTKQLIFNPNQSVTGEVTPAQKTEMERVIEELDTEITKTENLNIDANKVDNITTITLTDKDGNTKTVDVLDGDDYVLTEQDKEDIAELVPQPDLTDYATKSNTTLLNTLSLGRRSGTEIGENSIALGDNVEASGQCSFAEGAGASARGLYSHAEGNGCTATGLGSHAEGSGCESTATGTHSEGYVSRATGSYSHAEGLRTNSSGSGSHCEGYSCESSGGYSHAEGRQTQAIGQISHAEGQGTIANGTCSHVGGAYNVEDSYENWSEWVSGTSYEVGDKVKRTTITHNNDTGEDEVTDVNGYICKTANSDTSFTSSKWTAWSHRMNFIEMIGNGSGESSRSNARLLDWWGNEYLKGDLYVNCDDNGNNGKKVAYEKDVYVPVSGTTPTVVAEEDKIYKCGEVTTLNFTPSSTGLCEVIFTSGTTPTVLTLPNIVKMPDWFEEIEANHTYEISILDGVYGAVMSWES